MRTRRFLSISLIVLGISIHGLAQNKAKEMKGAEDRVNAASVAMTEIMRVSDRSIPRDLLAKAKAIVVFPGAIKVGFILGGQGGKGVVVRRLARGWSAPVFMNMGGGSIGPQIGGQKTDYVLVVMNDNGLNGLLQDKFEIGAEGSVAAGPVGRTAAASTNATLDAEILTYSRSKGLFAGVSLKGIVINEDKDMNRAIYQRSAREILMETPLPSVAAPKNLQRFPRTVASYAR